MMRRMEAYRACGLLLICCLAAVLFPARADAAESGTCGENLTWTLDDAGTLTISGSGAMEDFLTDLPAWYNYRDQIEEVVIEDGVTSIGGRAFDDCSNLISVTIPEGVTEIGSWYTFYGCSSLTSVAIPYGVTEIPWGTFYGCSSLTSLTIPESVIYISAGVFGGSSSLTSAGPIGGDYDYQFGWTTEIPAHAFAECSGLTSITIPENVTEIGEGTFAHCSSLTSVTIPDGVREIGESTFEGCSSLTSVTIPENVTEIDKWAFHDCTALTDVYYGGTAEDWDAITIDTSDNGNDPLLNATLHCALIARGTCGGEGDGTNLTWKLSSEGTLTVSGTGKMADYSGIGPWGSYRDQIEEVVIADGVTEIGMEAFPGCTSLTSITFPDGITVIGISAFAGCTSLTSVTIPSGNLHYFAFSSCSSLKSVTIGDGVTVIGPGAFEYCSSLTSVTIPESVDDMGDVYGVFSGCSGLTSAGPIGGDYNYQFGWTEKIPAGAFSDCDSLTSVIIPASVTEIGHDGIGAFYGCSSLTSAGPIGGDYDYQFGWTEKIPDQAFTGCDSLTSVTLPDGITEIGNDAFSVCSSLTSLTIPEAVTFIGSYAFGGCSSLTSLMIPSGITKINSRMFEGCSSLTSVTLPDGITEIGDSAFEYCSSLTSVTIPEAVTDISWRAFNNCTALTDVYYGGTAEDWDAITINEYLNAPLLDAEKHYALIARGTCGGEGDGTNLTWKLSSEGTLTISGNGEMGDYWRTLSPWWDYTDQIKEVVFENGVTSIGSYAFGSCSSLESVTLPDGLTEIGPYAFMVCSGLTSVTLPDGLTEIGDSAFEGCSSLTSVTIPEGVFGIGGGAFLGCSSLTSVTIPASVYEIGERPFAGCSGTSAGPIGGDYSYKFGWTTEIPAYAFMECGSLTSVTLPDGIIEIGSLAFADCSLTSVIIPSGVTEIGHGAFVYCDALTDVYYGGTRTEWDAVTIEPENDPLLNANRHYARLDIWTVTLNGNGAPSPESLSIPDGSALGTLPTPTRGGYDFAGGYTSAAGGAPASETQAVTSDLTFHAHWMILPDWAVRVTPGRGSGRYAPGDTVTILANEAVMGTRFLGWDGADGLDFTDGSAETRAAAFTMPAHDVSLTAVYETLEPATPRPAPTFTVTYTDGVEDEVLFEDQTASGLAFQAETPAFAGTPVREGYTFLGWSPEYLPIVVWDVTYTALWRQDPPVSCAVTYLPGEGSGEMPGDTLAYGARFPLPECGFTAPEGKRFRGWETGGFEFHPGDVLWFCSDRTLTAVWEPIPVTALFMDGYSGPWYFETVAYGSRTPVPEPPPDREGYTFSGWSPEIVDIMTETAIYTARWTHHTYKVRWVNAGGALIRSVTYTQGSLPAGTDWPDNPVHPDGEDAFIFAGWTKTGGTDGTDGADVTYQAAYRDAARPTETWYDADGTVLLSAYADEHAEAPDAVMPPSEQYDYPFRGWTTAEDASGNIAHRAEYDAVPRRYLVRFLDDQGVLLFERPVDYGATVGTVEDPAREGAVFAGWYTEPVCVNPFDFGVPVTGDLTLYAKWTPEEPEPLAIDASYSDGVLRYTITSLDEGTDALLIIAGYDASGRMRGSAIVIENAPASGGAALDAAAAEVRVFLLDPLTSAPLCANWGSSGG